MKRCFLQGQSMQVDHCFDSFKIISRKYLHVLPVCISINLVDKCPLNKPEKVMLRFVPKKRKITEILNSEENSK